MNFLEFAFFLSAAILMIIEEAYIFLVPVFLGIVILYLIIAACYPCSKRVTNLKKIMFATWDGPSEGIIRSRIEVNVENALEFLESFPQNQKPTLDHIVAKAGAEVMKNAEDLNGKIVFGKFLRFKQVNLGMLLSLGKDREMANILIQKCDQKSIEEIRDIYNSKVRKAVIQPSRKSGLGRLVPSFMMEFYLKVLQYISGDLDISIPFLGIKRRPFGAGMLHLVEGVDCIDVTAPFLPYANCSIQVTTNKVHGRVTVRDGKPRVVKTMIANFIVDHRFLDGARAKEMIPNFQKVFNDPWKFSSQKRREPEPQNNVQ